MKLETKVGAFFVGTIAVIGVLILSMEKIHLGGNGGRQEYSALFNQVAGLNPQSIIRIAGVKVGEVRTIRLEGGRAKVTFAMNKDVQRRIKAWRIAARSTRDRCFS